MCPSVFFRCFVSSSGVHTESQTEPFIWVTGVDCSNSINHDQVQVLSYSLYSLIVIPIIGIEPATSRWFHSKAPSKHLYSVMINRIGTVYPCGSNKGFSSKFCVDSQVWHERPEEGRRTSQSKHCDYNNKDEVNSLNILSKNNYQASSQKFI